MGGGGNEKGGVVMGKLGALSKGPARMEIRALIPLRRRYVGTDNRLIIRLLFVIILNTLSV
jgi:hypothetical protein